MDYWASEYLQTKQAGQDSGSARPRLPHVYLTGPPGVGKTTRAQEIAAERGLPVFHVDDRWDHDKHVMREWEPSVEALTEPHVVEGWQLLQAKERPEGEVQVLEAPREVLIDRLITRGWNDDDGRFRQGPEATEDAARMVDHFSRQVGDAKKRWKTAAFYHGSSEQLEQLAPRTDHGDPNVPAAVFATPHKAMALAYLGKSWGDRDIEQSHRDGEWALQEMRPGAFKDIYEGQAGWLHELPEDGFTKRPDSRGSDFEVISERPVTPVRVEQVTDIPAALQSAGVMMVPYSGLPPEAVERMRSRLSGFADGGQGYLDWVRETNPELADALGRVETKTSEFWASEHLGKRDAGAKWASPFYHGSTKERIGNTQLPDPPKEAARGRWGVPSPMGQEAAERNLVQIRRALEDHYGKSWPTSHADPDGAIQLANAANAMAKETDDYSHKVRAFSALPHLKGVQAGWSEDSYGDPVFHVEGPLGHQASAHDPYGELRKALFEGGTPDGVGEAPKWDGKHTQRQAWDIAAGLNKDRERAIRRPQNKTGEFWATEALETKEANLRGVFKRFAESARSFSKPRNCLSGACKIQDELARRGISSRKAVIPYPGVHFITETDDGKALHYTNHRRGEGVRGTPGFERLPDKDTRWKPPLQAGGADRTMTIRGKPLFRKAKPHE